MKKVLLQGTIKYGLYRLLLPSVGQHGSRSSRVLNSTFFNSMLEQFHCLQSSFFSNKLWHYRLGHLSSLIMNKVASQCNKAFSVNSLVNSFCTPCQLGKNHHIFAPSSTSKSNAPLELVFSDIWGPTPVASLEGYRYYILFEDNVSRYCWIYPMTKNSEATK